MDRQIDRHTDRKQPSKNLGRGKKQAIHIRIQIANKPMNRYEAYSQLQQSQLRNETSVLLYGIDKDKSPRPSSVPKRRRRPAPSHGRDLHWCPALGQDKLNRIYQNAPTLDSAIPLLKIYPTGLVYSLNKGRQDELARAPPHAPPTHHVLHPSVPSRV